mgnify:FL=1
MDATTEKEINSAIEEIVNIPGETGEKAGEEPVKEAQETQETEEVPQEEPVLEEELELEADSDLLDHFDAEDNEAEIETNEAPVELHKVKVDGEIKEVTYEELTRNFSGQSYIQKQMQEVAQLKKQYTQGLEALSNQRNEMDTFYQNAQQTGLREPTPPSRSEFETDPIGYMDLKMAYDEEKAAYDLKVSEFKKLQTQKAQDDEQRLQDFTRDQARLLSERLPEIADPKKGETIKKGLMEAGTHYGFSAAELGNVRDHRYILAMYDAARYRSLVKKRGNATSPKKESITPVKAGAKKRPTAIKANDRKKAEQRFQKSGGSVDSAIDLILDI